MECLCGYKFKDKDLNENRIYVDADKPNWMTSSGIIGYKKIIYTCPKCGTLKVPIR